MKECCLLACSLCFIVFLIQQKAACSSLTPTPHTIDWAHIPESFIQKTPTDLFTDILGEGIFSVELPLPI